jgi:hypothetical protein
MGICRQVHHKVSQVEHKVNYIQIALVVILVVMCAISSVGYSLIHRLGALRSDGSYVPPAGMNIDAECTTPPT